MARCAISDLTRDNAPHGDDEWAWFADVYGKVPDPSAATMAHVVHTAVYAAGAATAVAGASAVWHAVRVALWWVLGTGAGIGLAYGGYSLAKSGDTAPIPSQIHPAAPTAPSPDSIDSMPVEASPGPVDTLIAEAPAPQAPAPPAPAPIEKTQPDTPVATDPEPWAMSSLRTIADRSGVDFERLRAAVGDSTLDELAVLVNDAVQTGLPWLSLLRRAADGVARDQSPSAVVEMVKERIETLRKTQHALSMYASHYEVNAGADALEVGVTPSQLQQVWRASPHDATAALLALGGLVADGVPAPAATEAIVQSLAADLSDAALLALRTEVAADIARGVTPLAALRARVRSSGPSPSPHAP